jgi:hypothetical protein
LTDESTRRERKRLASNKQLYVLNRAGWLELREAADVDNGITNEAADDAIQRSMEEAAERTA